MRSGTVAGRSDWALAERLPEPLAQLGELQGLGEDRRELGLSLVGSQRTAHR
jgi:hypothetical protein